MISQNIPKSLQESPISLHKGHIFLQQNYILLYKSPKSLQNGPVFFCYFVLMRLVFVISG